MRKGFYYLIVFLLMESLVDAAILIDRIVAVVDDEPITWSELYKRTEFELSDQIVSLPEDKRRGIIKQNELIILQSMIDTKIIVNEAMKEGIRVAEEEIERAIAEIIKRNNLTRQQFVEVLRKRGVTLQYYRQILAEQILAQRYETLKLKDKITISEQEVEEYLQKKGIKKSEDETVILRQIFIPYSEDAEREIEVVLRELAEGKRFEDVAMRYSRGPASQQGGYLGSILINEIAEPLRKAIEKLSEGQYSQPIDTGQGYVILYLEKRLPSYEDYKKQVQDELFFTKLQRLRNIWLQEIRKRHYIEILL